MRFGAVIDHRRLSGMLVPQPERPRKHTAHPRPKCSFLVPATCRDLCLRLCTCVTSIGKLRRRPRFVAGHRLDLVPIVEATQGSGVFLCVHSPTHKSLRAPMAAGDAGGREPKRQRTFVTPTEVMGAAPECSIAARSLADKQSTSDCNSSLAAHTPQPSWARPQPQVSPSSH